MPNMLVVDLEATCDDNAPTFDMETIEVGAVWVAPDGAVLDRLQAFARPLINPHLTLFCSTLTNIHQADVDSPRRHSPPRPRPCGPLPRATDNQARRGRAGARGVISSSIVIAHDTASPR